MQNEIKLGLKENWQQFLILVIVNAFVGGMVGLERTIIPELAEQNFHIDAFSSFLSFIVVFGISKAITNYFTGALANKLGRKNLLVLGWLVAIPIPLIFIYTHHWNWIILANVLLGINQGLTWSSTVVMKIDLVGHKQRGFAMGINEFAGYLSVGVIALLTGWIAHTYGVHPYPFYVGFALIFLGLFSSLLLVKDTKQHVAKENQASNITKLKNIFIDTSFKHKNLSAVSQAGLINNLNDGMVWGILPILLNQLKFPIDQIGILVAIYPSVWGIGQLFTGKMADKYAKKSLLFWGMLIQSLALIGFVYAQTFFHFVFLTSILGLGTALVYPTFLAAIAENTHPTDRAESIGVFRLWRDLGYAVGAIITGIVADLFNLPIAISIIAGLTLMSALIIQNRMGN